MNLNVFSRPVAVLLAGLFLLVHVHHAVPASAQAPMLEFSGPTMGTRYLVKVFDPPNFGKDVRFEVDALLRHINDLMSTYIESSELSRFNDSESTEWFDVSIETASVVQFAQTVAQKTDGAFDVTVGPLVNAWSFGPDPRTQSVPDDETLEQLRALVGFDKLSVRLEPPALRKSIPQLQVDLSAIAKGYAVDRVVALLNELGAPNVFVEIGGEVGTSGNKDGQWWRVGIQVPDVQEDEVLIAHPLSAGSDNDSSMATSGDYRNFFEVDGVRYSHTMDPRTGRPIEHDLASVSVIASTCMAADAWATAMNVLGSESGLRIAQQEGLDTLFISRQASAFRLIGTGALAQYGSQVDGDPSGEAELSAPKEETNQTTAIAILSACAFGLILSAMAVGVIFGRRAISGSCGGLGNVRNDDGSVSCSLCSNPSEACKELRNRMTGESQVQEEHAGGH